MASGIPFVSNGVNVGFTDFSEFPVGEGLPSGITEYGNTANSPTDVAIADDNDEGHYFQMTGHGTNNAWGFGLDAFDGKMDSGEVLTRVYANFNINLVESLGGASSMSGVLGADFDCWGGVLHRLTSQQQAVLRATGTIIKDGGTVATFGAAIRKSLQNGTWIWLRIRRIPNVGTPSKDDWKATAWYGALVDEPSSPDGEFISQLRQISGFGAVGWVVKRIVSTSEQRIAYLSFSGDPELVSPPIPETQEHVRATVILDTTLTTDLELNQTIATRVQLEGTITEDVDV